MEGNGHPYAPPPLNSWGKKLFACRIGGWVALEAVEKRQISCPYLESNINSSYKYYVFGHYPSSSLYLKHRPVYFSKQRFGDWILSPSSGKTYSVGPNQ
jgi:hypothetical protein